MVRFSQLVFDDYLVIAIGAQNIQLEVAYRVFGCDQFALAQFTYLSQGVEVLGQSKPRGKLACLVLPCFAQRDTLEFAQLLRNAGHKRVYPVGVRRGRTKGMGARQGPVGKPHG